MQFEKFQTFLLEGFDKIHSFSIASSQVSLLFHFHEILLKWNSKLNLTGHKGELESIEKNFIDSLTLIPFLKDDIRILDFGSGAGFPGLILKIIFPKSFFILVESDQRKSAFLATVIRELKLDKVEIFPKRVDVCHPPQNFIQNLDALVSRATVSAERLLLLAGSCLKKEAMLIVMANKDFVLDIELSDFSIDKNFDYELPYSFLKRKLICFKKLV